MLRVNSSGGHGFHPPAHGGGNRASRLVVGTRTSSLICGARAVLQNLKRPSGTSDSWLARAAVRRNPNIAAVRRANRDLARHEVFCAKHAISTVGLPPPAPAPYSAVAPHQHRSRIRVGARLPFAQLFQQRQLGLRGLIRDYAFCTVVFGRLRIGSCEFGHGLRNLRRCGCRLARIRRNWRCRRRRKCGCEYAQMDAKVACGALEGEA